jgi:hypothetical protein
MSSSTVFKKTKPSSQPLNGKIKRIAVQFAKKVVRMLSLGFGLKCDFGLIYAADTTLLYLCYFLVLPQDELAFKKIKNVSRM